MTTDFLMYFNR